MSGEVNTRKALIAATKSFLVENATIATATGAETGLPVLADADAINWENREFEPDGKSEWASVFYRPNLPEVRTLGDGGQDEVNGFVQIDLNAAPGSGEGKLLEWERKARIFFHPGRSFSHDGQKVTVTQSGMTQGRLVLNSWRRSITVVFRSHTTRAKIG
tara:strand:+ start:194 stop:676 length:483 start_codon:yes stop_codon:yes gene_type:complete